MKLPYLKQDCDLTLKEGLELHYRVNPSFEENVKLVPTFYNHDIVHVLFGLDTSIPNESLADSRCIFSTNWGFKKYFSDYFNNPNAVKIVKAIFKENGYIKSIFLSFICIPKIFRVCIDSKKMYKKWELYPNDDLLNTKLSDLRNKYNITIIN
tara:strand:+ start:59 stop:517 length:459 start_codon:yes stop_codon:yes gene_type:complete